MSADWPDYYITGGINTVANTVNCHFQDWSISNIQFQTLCIKLCKNLV
jgi:hypothetical protein